jgi:hypothetical protein
VRASVAWNECVLVIESEAVLRPAVGWIAWLDRLCEHNGGKNGQQKQTDEDAVYNPKYPEKISQLYELRIIPVRVASAENESNRR